MLDIMSLVACLRQCLDATTLRQRLCVSAARLSMTGRVTMRGIARWRDTGGRYRPVQRFFNPSVTWCPLPWWLIRQPLLEPHEVVMMRGEQVVGTTSGKKTYGVERFCSSL